MRILFFLCLITLVPTSDTLLWSASKPGKAVQAVKPLANISRHPLSVSKTSYGYLAYLPPGYKAKGGKHPLVLFLHGMGELGDGESQLDKVAKNGPFKFIKKDPSLFAKANAIVLGPQGMKADKWWKQAKLEAFLDFATTAYAVDPRRIYVTGLSMGGGGTWMLAKRRYKDLAAIVPICGAARPGKQANLGKLPMWVFHSIADKTVGFDHSRQWMDALATKPLMSTYPYADTQTKTPAKSVQTASFSRGTWSWTSGQQAPDRGRQLTITVFPDASHNSWTRAYKDPAMWQWLFSQKR